ncbi:hypothetical protein LIPSTDRAFT_121048 [Lipomyces starkeyi NRRL Y-11557]|uniref:Uncharacterized protein n=1 Tax=Lipomyces starkeyi NRRL Y-11557 TaxID=675824 RepID=A0A1E3PUA0_LIPST|nr:hypothetical protein LIPSTDRAFT_121048 [Lipomyces starkeyi NRRL Y-11557]
MKHVKAYLETKTSVKGVHILVGGFMEAIFSARFGVEGTSYENAAEYTAAVAWIAVPHRSWMCYVDCRVWILITFSCR